jgi:hypothetical protein
VIGYPERRIFGLYWVEEVANIFLIIASKGMAEMDQLDINNDNLFSKRVRAGKRTYFFDVKATRSAKDFYVVITESRRISEEKYEKHKIFLYKEDFQKFIDAISETVDHVERDFLQKIEQPVET